MPRDSRIDAPGALHHVIARGIERTKIYRDDLDRKNFLERLSTILPETDTHCFAWALLPNHFHLLLRTGQVPIATVMRRLLTGYAVSYNRRHRRHGHLFQNRYKSILCQEERYLLELVRYIHLNPLRSRIVPDIKALNTFPFTGHGVILGKFKNDWQDTKYVLRLFGKTKASARNRYRLFVEEGIAKGRRNDLIGGGLIRSSGGWAKVIALRKAKIFQKSDERILGDGDFVEEILSSAQERFERKYELEARGFDLNKIAEKVSDLMGVKPSDLLGPRKERLRVKARSLLCFWASKELGISMAELSRELQISLSAVGVSVKRGEKIALDNNYKLI